MKKEHNLTYRGSIKEIKNKIKNSRILKPDEKTKLLMFVDEMAKNLQNFPLWSPEASHSLHIKIDYYSTKHISADLYYNRMNVGGVTFS